MEAPDAAAALAAARQVCTEWGLTPAEVEALVAGEERAMSVLRIAYLLDGLFSGSLPRLWMTIASRRLGASTGAPIRPVDHAIRSPEGLADLLQLLEGWAQGQ